MDHAVLGVFAIGESQGMGHEPGVVFVLDFATESPAALVGAEICVRSDNDELHRGPIAAAQVHAGSTSVFCRDLDYKRVADAMTATVAIA